MDENAIKNLTDAIKLLPSKDDLNGVYNKLKDLFFHELGLRDKKISELEEKIESLQDQNKRLSDLAANNFNEINEKIIKIEENLDSSKKAVVTNIYKETPESEVIVKNKTELLIIGDSIIKYINTEKINPGGRNKHICVPGGTIQDIRRALISYSKENIIDCVILNVGTNHLSFESPVSVSDQLGLFCADIRSNLPGTRLLFSGILPKLDDGNTRGISFVNNQLFKLSKEHKFKIIFHKKFFKEDGTVNFDLYAKDGIHLNRHGVAVLGATLKYFYYH